MFNCMLRYLAKQWWWLPIFVIVGMVVGFFTGGWWGVLIGLGSDAPQPALTRLT